MAVRALESVDADQDDSSSGEIVGAEDDEAVEVSGDRLDDVDTPSSGDSPTSRGDSPTSQPQTSEDGSGLWRLLLTASASAATTAVGMALLFTRWIREAAPPELRYAPSEENVKLVMAVPLLLRSYIPNVLTRNGHLASLFGYIKLPSWRHRCDRELVPLSDGGTVSVEWSHL